MSSRRTIQLLSILLLTVYQLIGTSFAQIRPSYQKTERTAQDTVNMIDKLLNSAQGFQGVGNLSESMENYLRAIRLLEKHGNNDLLADTYEKVGNIYSNNNLFEKSTEYYLKAAQLAPQNLKVQRDLGNAYFQMEEYSQALDYYSAALELCLSANKHKESLTVSEQIIACYHKMGDHDRALKNERIILARARELGDSAAVATTFNNIGYAYKYLEDYKEAIIAIKTSLKMHDEFKLSTSDKVAVLLNLGIVYQNSGDYDNALKYLLKATQLVEASKDKRLMAKMYDLLGSIYYAQEDYHNAHEYSRDAIAVGKEVNDAPILRSSYLTSSLVNQKNDDFQEALEDYKVHLQINDSLLREERLRQQALLQQQLLFERSERELQQLISAKEVSDLARRQQELLVEQQKKELELSKQESALQAAKLARQELEREKANQALLLAQKLLEAEKRDREISKLKQQEALQKIEAKRLEEEAKRKELELRSEKDKLEREAALQEEERKRVEAESAARTKLFISIGIFFLVVIGLILWFLKLTQRKNKTLATQKSVIRDRNLELSHINEELSTQQELIEERNTELSQMNEEIAAQRDMVSTANDQLNVALVQITDSVRYAKRIQDSILLPPQDIIPNFNDAFIYFQPRDIVSGDFYWYAKSESRPIYEEQHGFEGISKIFKGIEDEKHVIAAVDCTGHGVPGAFMSLIGNDLLNDIVNLNGTTSPDAILNELSKSVRRTLKQEQTSNQDGMDMALCTINYATKEVQFAGAKNSLVYIQDGEIKQLKGDKMPIGGRDLYGGRSFTAHTISIEKPTYFYIFSDGFQDQFGGPNNRKFMIKRFRQLLFDIHHKPMATQHQILEETLKEWRGPQKQLDDVLVIGFKCGEEEIS